MSFSLRIVLTVLLVCVSSLSLQAQSAASARGVVVDPSGSAVANARVSISSESTGATRSINTGSAGEFVFPQLIPGRYRLEVDAPGFARPCTQRDRAHHGSDFGCGRRTFGRLQRADSERVG